MRPVVSAIRILSFIGLWLFVAYSSHAQSKSVKNDSSSLGKFNLDTLANNVEEFINDDLVAKAQIDIEELEEPVSIPKLYIIIAAGLLFTVIALLVAKLKRARKKYRSSSAGDGNGQQAKRDRNDAFQGFAIALFDPYYFRYRFLNKTMAYAGDFNEPGFQPDIEFQFKNKDVQYNFAVKTLYREFQKENLIRITSMDELNSLRHFEIEKDLDVYLVIGLKGSPDEPREIYLLPLKILKKETYAYPELQPFRKWGMFFYNAAAKRLQ